MGKFKHELILISAALLIFYFFLAYEFADSPKFNSVEAVALSSTSSFFERETTSRATGTVNINTAGMEELCTLELIGESKATAIIEYREKNGNFRKPEEIMLVDGISNAIYNKNINRITVQ